MPPKNPHRMITQGKTGFRVVPDRLVLTAATSSPTPSPIPSSARATLADPHWRAAMEEEYRALISSPARIRPGGCVSRIWCVLDTDTAWIRLGYVSGAII
jgi:hypothetical protein